MTWDLAAPVYRPGRKGRVVGLVAGAGGGVSSGGVGEVKLAGWASARSWGETLGWMVAGRVVEVATRAMGGRGCALGIGRTAPARLRAAASARRVVTGRRRGGEAFVFSTIGSQVTEHPPDA